MTDFQQFRLSMLHCLQRAPGGAVVCDLYEILPIFRECYERSLEKFPCCLLGCRSSLAPVFEEQTSRLSIHIAVVDLRLIHIAERLFGRPQAGSLTESFQFAPSAHWDIVIRPHCHVAISLA